MWLRYGGNQMIGQKNFVPGITTNLVGILSCERKKKVWHYYPRANVQLWRLLKIKWEDAWL